MIDGSLFNINFDDLAKLFKAGQITKVYLKMYKVAVDIAKSETRDYLNHLQGKMLENEFNDAASRAKRIANHDKIEQEVPKLTFLTDITDYELKRIKYHMDEMKELLKLSLQDK